MGEAACPFLGDRSSEMSVIAEDRVKIEVNGRVLALHDIDDSLFERLLLQCGSNCMATDLGAIEVIYGVYNNIRYVVENDIPGDIVECGVWKGGLMQLAALTLKELGDTSRAIYLYDTFDGMPEPGEHDVDWKNNSPHKKWSNLKWKHKESELSQFGFGGFVDDVRQTVESTGYPAEKFVFVPGLVEDTIPGTVPAVIAYLRLDTDWYQSTKHELTHLFPLLSRGGVLVIDDYGYYKGARRATDEYLREMGIKILLSRISGLGVREGVKQ